MSSSVCRLVLPTQAKISHGRFSQRRCHLALPSAPSLLPFRWWWTQFLLHALFTKEQPTFSAEYWESCLSVGEWEQIILSAREPDLVWSLSITGVLMSVTAAARVPVGAISFISQMLLISQHCNEANSGCKWVDFDMTGLTEKLDPIWGSPLRCPDQTMQSCGSWQW